MSTSSGLKGPHRPHVQGNSGALPYPPRDDGRLTTAADARNEGHPNASVETRPLKSPRVSSNVPWKWLLLLAVVAAVVTGATIWGGSGGGNQRFSSESLLLHTVRRQPMAVTVVERGNLESQSVIPVMCEVDDYRRDGFNGTAIIWVIPNGSVVEEGDLLVEFDEAPIREQMDEQVLETEQARELMLLAEARLENQLSQNATNLAEAKLKVKLADLNVRMFTDETNGTHRLEVESLKREIEDLNNEILSSQANLELKRNDMEGIEELFKLGYAGKSEFERSELDFLQAQSQYASKVNRLRTQLSTLKKKETYEREMQLLDLQGKLDTAKRAQEQVIKNNSALVTQLKATLAARKEQFGKEEELLERYREQHKACKVYSPSDGMVAYTESRYGEAAPGQHFRIRQEILSIPNLDRMQVETAVHESALDQVRAGQKASIRVESFSDRRYTGTVDSVAVLPQNSRRSLGADTRFYETVIKIDDQVSQLKPGMTAIVEIDVDSVDDALTVPLQAVVSRGKQTYCYVERGGDVERVAIDVGLTNDHQVQVVKGLVEGDQVVMNPMSLDIEDREDEQSEQSEQSEQKSTETQDVAGKGGADPLANS